MLMFRNKSMILC